MPTGNPQDAALVIDPRLRWKRTTLITDPHRTRLELLIEVWLSRLGD